MQNKLYKKSTIFLGITLLIDLALIIGILLTKKYWEGYRLLVMIGFVLITFILSTIYSFYDLNADILYIKKCVRNGDIALAKITNGTYYRVIRNAKFKTYILWKLELNLFDQEMNQIKTSTIEKFSKNQKEIPSGHVFVTYNEKRPKDILVVPSVILQSIPEYAPLVEDYEKAVKPTYLNAYIKDGLVIQTYASSIKEQNKEKERIAKEAQERKEWYDKKAKESLEQKKK